jgi:hypothetical protein
MGQLVPLRHARAADFVREGRAAGAREVDRSVRDANAGGHVRRPRRRRRRRDARQAGAGASITVCLYKLMQLTHKLESARFQPLHLSSQKPVSSLCFQMQLVQTGFKPLLSNATCTNRFQAFAFKCNLCAATSRVYGLYTAFVYFTPLFGGRVGTYHHVILHPTHIQLLTASM